MNTQLFRVLYVINYFIPGIRAVPVNRIPVWNDLTVIRTHGDPKQEDHHRKCQLHLICDAVLVHNVNANGEKTLSRCIDKLREFCSLFDDHVCVTLVHKHYQGDKSKVKAQRMNFSGTIRPASLPPQTVREWNWQKTRCFHVLHSKRSVSSHAFKVARDTFRAPNIIPLACHIHSSRQWLLQTLLALCKTVTR